MKRPLLLIGAATAMLVAPLAYGTVIYQNDFSMRMSTEAVPYSGWREVPYSTGKLASDDYNNPFNGSVQDNWVRVKNVGYCPVKIVDDGGNQEAVFCNAEGDDMHAIIKHRIGNTFTSGVVTAQCDLRAPTTWTGNPLMQRFMLGDETFFSPDTDTNGGGECLQHLAARAGLVEDGGRKFWKHGGTSADGASSTSWYRLALTVNLDTRKWSCAFYDLGMGHPSLNTATPSTAVCSFDNLDMPYAAVTAISALGIDCYRPHGGLDASDIDNAGQFDNIRVSHNGVEYYINDFAVRRSRCMGGTVTASYSATSLVTNAVGTETYASGASLYPKSTNNKTVSQPIGIDGWRRLNSDLPLTPTIYSDNGNNTMQFGDYSISGIAATTIGQTLRTGKVRISADVRATAIAGNGTGQGVYLYAGSDNFYNANYNQFGNMEGLFARVGIVGTSTSIDNATYRRPYYRTSTGVVYGTGDEWVKQVTWLRFTIEADLDVGTYSCSIRDQGAEHLGGDSVDGETVYYSKTNIEKINASATTISSIAFSAYSATVMFDNIKVWHKPTGAVAETLVYDNRFNTRKICYQNLRESRLVGTIFKEPNGQDGWIRANQGRTEVFVRNDGANPVLTFGNGKDSLAYAMHDISMLCSNGKIKTQVDVCPPGGWLGGSRNTFFWLGGDKFHEGNLKDGDGFYQNAATFFGFRDAVGATGTGGVYTNITLCAYNGNGVGGGAYVDSSHTVDPTHWYRFVATTKLDEGTSDIAVYDMGTEHPTIATATPAVPVETFTGLAFRRSAANIGGVSAVCVSAMGTIDNTINTASGVYWDNISIDYRGGGFELIIK